MYKFKYWLRNFFGFSQKETNGFIILTILMFSFLIMPIVFNYVLGEQRGTTEDDRKKLDSLASAWAKGKDNSTDFSFTNVSKKDLKKGNTEYFLFNPNTSTIQDFKKLGLHEFLAKRIIKYREKGGIFKIKNDLKKIYGFSPQLYERLESYIDLPENLNGLSKTSRIEKSTSNLRKQFDVNAADTTEFIKLKGIGSKLALRIVKYRDKLGGFIYIEQYKEVFGLDSLALKELMEYAFIRKDFIPEKIKLNSADLNTLYGHPYIGQRFSKMIFNYRLQHGRYNSLEELYNIKIIDAISYEKMKNYLTLE